MNPKVLRLDDSRENLYLLERMLRTLDEGIDFVGFTEAGEALAWCRENEPDLCLIDYRLWRGWMASRFSSRRAGCLVSRAFR